LTQFVQEQIKNMVGMIGYLKE